MSENQYHAEIPQDEVTTALIYYSAVAGYLNGINPELLLGGASATFSFDDGVCNLFIEKTVAGEEPRDVIVEG